MPKAKSNFSGSTLLTFLEPRKYLRSVGLLKFCNKLTKLSDFQIVSKDKFPGYRITEKLQNNFFSLKPTGS